MYLLAGEVTWCVGNKGSLLGTFGGGNVGVLFRLLLVSQENEECHQLGRHCGSWRPVWRYEILI